MREDEQWDWLLDMTDTSGDTSVAGGPSGASSISSLETDEFDDSEEADRRAEESKKQGGFLWQVAHGYQWMREEERVGKWLGLILAILIWGTVAAVLIQAHWYNSNYITVGNQSVPAGHGWDPQTGQSYDP